MAICEDAPCCGCCGTSLYGSEVPTSDDYSYDAMMGDRYRAYEDEDECRPHDGYCLIDDPDECTDYWLDFHADGMEDQWLDGSYED